MLAALAADTIAHRLFPASMPAEERVEL